MSAGTPPPAKRLWRRPELRRDEELEREHRTSWLELFLDLVFVVVVEELTHVLADANGKPDVSASTLGEFCLLFVPVWWVWIGCTYYNDRFETDDVSHRLFMFLTMLPLAAMAYSAGARLAIDNATEIFSWAYVAARVVLVVMWLRAGWHSPEARPMTRRYGVGFSASLLLWTASAFVPEPARFFLWGAGLLFDLLTPLTTLGIQARLPRLSSSHLPERFGTLTLIVLGECVSCVISGPINIQQLDPTIGAQAGLGMALCFGLWWIYFDHVMGRRSKPGLAWSSAWAYAHLPLLVSLTSISIAVRSLVVAQNDVPEPPVRWLACGAMAVALAALGVIELTLRKDRRTPIHLLRVEMVRFAAAGAVLLLGVLGGGLHSLVLLGILTAVAVALVIHGLFQPTQGPPAHASV